MKRFIGITLAFISLSAAAQKSSHFTAEQKKEMCVKVTEACRHAWEGYRQYAWGKDDLQPLTKTGKNWYSVPLLMTPVDAYDTFILLGMQKEAGEAKQLILSQLNFDVDVEVQVFEITIRLLAGLETAYERTGEAKFLFLAKDLANRLLPAFQTPTGMPYRYVNLKTGQTRDGINNPAEIGTLLLEFAQLTKLTGEKKYLEAGRKAILAVYERRSPIGLVGTQIDVSTGKWTNAESHISGMIDSYFEYLYKGWKLLGDKELKLAWEVHQAAIKKYMLRPTANGTFTAHVDMNTGKEISTTYGALDAFYAGLAAFSGDVKLGKEVQKANFYMWTHFTIEPEEFDFASGKLLSAAYILRPENLESCFYLYRLTSDEQYLWMGKKMVEDLLTHCRVDAGYASLRNVTTQEKMNSMQSFFFAETLKYAYLIFAPEKTLDLSRYVFNTEAHPFRIRK